VKVLVYDPDRCTGCHECEDACSERWFKEVDRSKSAIHITTPNTAGNGFQVIVCTQCGDCIDVCPTMAISRAQNGVVVIRKSACVGCLACVSFCDIWAMRTHPDYTEPFKCIACGRCVEACSEDALSIQELADASPSETEKWAEKVEAR
jgi:carbon-monoxide dehydrogenase iron sulfur subunit